jgi:hypothetical protein
MTKISELPRERLTHLCLRRRWQMDEYLRRLVRHGEEEGFDELPIHNAMCLADGSLPLVVVLEELCGSADWFDYETMVWGDEDANINTLRHDGSATLQEVDSLIREAYSSILRGIASRFQHFASRGEVAPRKRVAIPIRSQLHACCQVETRRDATLA